MARSKSPLEARFICTQIMSKNRTRTTIRASSKSLDYCALRQAFVEHEGLFKNERRIWSHHLCTTPQEYRIDFAGTKQTRSWVVRQMIQMFKWLNPTPQASPSLKIEIVLGELPTYRYISIINTVGRETSPCVQSSSPSVFVVILRSGLTWLVDRVLTC